MKQPLGRSEGRDINALGGQPSRGGAEHQTGNPGCGYVKDACIKSGGDIVLSFGWEILVSSLVKCNEQGAHWA